MRTARRKPEKSIQTTITSRSVFRFLLLEPERSSYIRAVYIRAITTERYSLFCVDALCVRFHNFFLPRRRFFLFSFQI